MMKVVKLNVVCLADFCIGTPIEHSKISFRDYFWNCSAFTFYNDTGKALHWLIHSAEFSTTILQSSVTWFVILVVYGKDFHRIFLWTIFQNMAHILFNQIYSCFGWPLIICNECANVCFSLVSLFTVIFAVQSPEGTNFSVTIR